MTRVSCTGLAAVGEGATDSARLVVGAAVVGHVEDRTQRSPGHRLQRRAVDASRSARSGPAVIGTTPIRVALGRCTTTPGTLAICAVRIEGPVRPAWLGSIGRLSWLSLLTLVRRPDLAGLRVAELRLAATPADRVLCSADQPALTAAHSQAAQRAVRKVVHDVSRLADYMSR